MIEAIFKTYIWLCRDAFAKNWIHLRKQSECAKDFSNQALPCDLLAWKHYRDSSPFRDRISAWSKRCSEWHQLRRAGRPGGLQFLAGWSAGRAELMQQRAFPPPSVRSVGERGTDSCNGSLACMKCGLATQIGMPLSKNKLHAQCSFSVFSFQFSISVGETVVGSGWAWHKSNSILLKTCECLRRQW